MYARPNQSLREALQDGTASAMLVGRKPRSKASREDIAQEAIRRGLESEAAGRYKRDLAAPTVYLAGIARLVDLEHIRAEARSARSADSFDEVPAPQADPLDRLIFAERREALLVALGQLASDEDRDLLIREPGALGDLDLATTPMTNTERGRRHRLLAMLRQALIDYM